MALRHMRQTSGAAVDVGVVWRGGTAPSWGGRSTDNRAEVHLLEHESLIDKWPTLPASHERLIDTEGRGLVMDGIWQYGRGNIQWAWFVAAGGDSDGSEVAARRLLAGGDGGGVHGDGVSEGRESRYGAW